MPSAGFRIVVDGVEITDKVNQRLISMGLTLKREGEADELQLVLSNADRKLRRPPRGAIITVSLGWRGEALKSMGKFKVDEDEWTNNPGQISITAKSADFTADLRIRRERSWRNTTLGAVLSDLAGGGGLTPKVAPDLASKPITMLAQSRESDLALMRRLGRQYDAVATVKNGCLLFAPVGSGKTASGKALPTLTLPESAGDKISAKSVSRGEYKGVIASWHHGGSGERKTVTAGAKDGARRLKTVYSSEAAALQAAQAEWTRIQRGSSDLTWSLSRGRADLIPEVRFKVEIDEPSISGPTWLAKEVVHSVDKTGGWKTNLQAETAL